jgi:hypothetical protein
VQVDAMDMTAFLHRKITNAVLLARHEWRYEGRITRVEVQQVFNQWKYTKDELVPVIMFEDGYEWIPNLGARNDLTKAWGADTDFWIGRYVAIYLKKQVRIDKKSGEAVEKLVKVAEPLLNAL